MAIYTSSLKLKGYDFLKKGQEPSPVGLQYIEVVKIRIKQRNMKKSNELERKKSREAYGPGTKRRQPIKEDKTKAAKTSNLKTKTWPLNLTV